MKNSKRLMLCLSVMLSLYFQKSHAQRILHLTEVTQGNKVYEVTPEEKDSRIVKYPNVDINSSIIIKLDTVLIRQNAINWIGVTTSLPKDNIQLIAAALKQRSAIIQKMVFVSKDVQKNHDNLNEISTILEPLMTIVSELDEDNAMRVKANEIFSIGEKDPSIAYSKFFDLLDIKLKNIQQEYNTAIENNKVYFRMGGFVNNTPIHIEGFDNYKEGSYFFVQPFVTAIPEDQKKEFDKISQEAAQANKDAGKFMKDKVKEVLSPLADEVKKAIEQEFSGSLTSFEAALSGATAIKDSLKIEVEINKNALIYFKTNVDLLIAAINDVENPAYTEQLLTQINSVMQGYTKLEHTIKESQLRIKKLLDKTLPAALANFNAGYTQGLAVISHNIDNINLFFDSQTQLNISLIDKLNESFLKLSENVKKIPLCNIPSETLLDLRYTGERKDGDKLYLKAVLGKQSGDNQNVEEKTIEFIPIGLYYIGLHNSIQAVLIMVDNLSVQYQSKRQIQFDPSYSVLFKFGSRKSSFYNNYIEFGAGLNIATLDFNNDNSPEVGIGLVVSCFKDYLQVGYGRNLVLDQNYWFAGLRLPFLGIDYYGKNKIRPSGL